MPSMQFWDNSQMSPKDLTIWRKIGQEAQVLNPKLTPTGIVQNLTILRKEKGLAVKGNMRDHPMRIPKTLC